MGKYPDMKVRVESAFHFPQVGQDPQDPGLQLGSSNDTTDNDTFSFAKMLKSGVAKPSTYVPRSQTFPSLTPKKNEDSEPEPEDYVPPPPKASLGDALAAAFAQATTISAQPDLPDQNQSGGSKKKKKKMKGQKISLTGPARPLLRDYH